MKKYILTLLSAVLLCNLALAVDFYEEIKFDRDSVKEIINQDLKDLANNIIKREITDENSLFADERVEAMCREWPSCKEWAKYNKLTQDPNFKVVDAEVERWISKWEGKKAIWEYKFYVQTEEKGQTKAYLFTRGIEGFPYNEPVLIRKFPGHPVPYAPSEDISYPKENPSLWPGFPQWKYSGYETQKTSSQFIYKYDEEGNAVWEKRLYVKVWYWSWVKSFYFRAYQTSANSFYTYEAPVEIDTFPYPHF